MRASARESVHKNFYLQVCTYGSVCTSPYVRVCTYKSVLTSLYIRVCTYKSAPTSLYIQICTYKPVHKGLYIQICTYELVHTSLKHTTEGNNRWGSAVKKRSRLTTKIELSTRLRNRAQTCTDASKGVPHTSWPKQAIFDIR